MGLYLHSGKFASWHLEGEVLKRLIVDLVCKSVPWLVYWGIHGRFVGCLLGLLRSHFDWRLWVVDLLGVGLLEVCLEVFGCHFVNLYGVCWVVC